MSNVKLDPEPPSDPGSSTQLQGTNSTHSKLILPRLHTPLTPGTSVLRNSLPTNDSVTYHNRGLRPIAPKPQRPKLIVPKLRKRHGPEGVPRPLVFVSFSLYGQCLSAVPESVHEERSRYATTVIPRKQLRVLGRSTLRLHTVIPRSRLSSTAVSLIRKAIAPPNTPVPPNKKHIWICSHQTVPPFAPSDSNETSRLDPSPKSTSQINGLIKDEITSFKRLRPTARLLVRLGQQLTRTQFARMATNECGCGHLVVPDETFDYATDSSDATSVPSSGQLPPPDSILASKESTHLEWRPKPSHPRWTRLRQLCKFQRCPFIPSSIFQLHRHLELGHQHYLRPMRVDPGAIVHAKEHGHLPKNNSKIPGQDVVNLFARLYVPLVINCHSTQSQQVCCPVCVTRRGASSAILAHIKEYHPFISAQPLEKPANRCCAICGLLTTFPLRTARVRTTISGAIVHSHCGSTRTVYQHSAWAAYDAHPLACLILFPNQHSRLALPSDVASQLYRSLDFVVSNKLKSAEPLDTYTLRCSLTISALLGDLVVLELKGQIASTGHVLTMEESGDVPYNGVPEFPTATNLRLSSEPPTQSIPTGNVPTLSTDTSLLPDPSNSLSSDQPPGSKRTRPVSPESLVPAKRVSIVPPETAPPELPMIPNGDSAAHSISNSTDQFESRSTKAVETHSDLTHSGETPVAPPPSVNSKPTRNNLSVIDTPCELCNTMVSTMNQRTHLVKAHGRNVPSIPSDPCVSCGQLFWTVDGLAMHRSVRCEFCCSNEICRSTLYIHMALKHMEELCARLMGNPKQCMLCNKPQDNLVSHLADDHFCSIPADVFHRLQSEKHKSNIKNSSDVYLHELTPLYIKSLSNQRDMCPGVGSFPENVVSRDPVDPTTSAFKCSVCSLNFISNIQLDMHVVQCRHFYWCPCCLFNCSRLARLVAHYNSCPKKKPSFRFIRLGNGVAPPPPNVTITTNSITAITSILTASISTPAPQLLPPPPLIPATVTASAPKEAAPEPAIRRAVGPVSQFHGCDLCPVFCLSLEDLDTHRQTVHNCLPLRQVTATVPASVTSVTPALPRTLTTSVIVTTQPYVVTAPPPSFTPRSRVVIPQAAPNRSIYPTPFVPNQTVTPLPMTSIVLVPRTVVAQPRLAAMPPPRPLAPRPSAPGSKPAEDFVCPMCEFHSSSRNAVMAHLTETH